MSLIFIQFCVICLFRSLLQHCTAVAVTASLAVLCVCVCVQETEKHRCIPSWSELC